jgi:hypothetical protein
MNAGDTFIDGKYHPLWIVISEPAIDPQRVVIVNPTTYTIDEQSACILHKGEHPFIRHKTAVRYRDARAVASADLPKLLMARKLTPRAACSAALLKKLRDGASKQAELLPEECRSMLDEQGLI